MLFIVTSWLLVFANGNKIGFYCSDVSGAFDKVDSERLLLKLSNLGISSTILQVINSWLQERSAQVVVSGGISDTFSMMNMIYQGTVWGPPLWNCYYKDANVAIRSKDFEKTMFANDLNAFKVYTNFCPNYKIF